MPQKIIVVNEETGESKEIYGEVVEEGSGDKIIRAGTVEYLKEQSRHYEDKTPFVWVMFQYDTPLFPELSQSDLTRLMYFSTFCTAGGYVMHKKDVRNTLLINANQLSAFSADLQNAGIIHNANDVYCLDSKFFSVGEIKTELDYIRLFCDSTRELYEGCVSTAEHKTLSYIFKMIPYVNRQTNILSYNQEEQAKDAIIFMPFSKFCTLVDYDATHAARLRKALLQYRINGELAVGFFDDLTQLTDSGSYVLVNPKLFFGGLRTTSTYQEICALFAAEREIREQS